MDANDIREALRQKMESCWLAYKAEVLRLPSEEIFDHAEEINAARFCYEQLTEYLSNYPEEYLEYLLRFEDPLMVIRDQWISEQSIDLSEEFDHALWYLKDSGAAEQDYPLDPDWPAEQCGPTMC